MQLHKNKKKIVIIKIISSFLLKLFFLKKKIKHIIKITEVLIITLRGAKKLIKSAKNERYIKPSIAISEKFFKLVIFCFVNSLPKTK